MKLQLLFFLLLTFTLTIQGQSDVFPKQSIVLDAGGIGGYGSLNYERPFWAKQDFFLSYRVGFSMYRFRDYERKFNPDLLFPITLQVGWRFKSHQVVAGVGQTISSIVQASSDFQSKERNNGLNANFIIGYRFQRIGKPFSVQIAYTPLFEHYARWRQWGSLSFGYSFFKKNKSAEELKK